MSGWNVKIEKETVDKTLEYCTRGVRVGKETESEWTNIDHAVLRQTETPDNLGL